MEELPKRTGPLLAAGMLGASMAMMSEALNRVGCGANREGKPRPYSPPKGISRVERAKRTAKKKTAQASKKRNRK